MQSLNGVSKGCLGANEGRQCAGISETGFSDGSVLRHSVD